MIKEGKEIPNDDVRNQFKTLFMIINNPKSCDYFSSRNLYKL